MNIMKATMAAGTADRPRPLDVFIEVADPAWTDAVAGASARAEECARAAFEGAARAGASLPARACEVSIVLAGDAMVAGLNAQYRGKKGPTNVLSFPASGGPLPGDPTVPDMLGDVVIAYGVSAAEAADQGIALGDHLSHLVVHGMLHLMGFDHETESEALRMEGLETDILRGLGVADPYAREA